ncbi:MAG: M43 family zinc metalloprotease [Flavobacteriales bacterium]
MKNLILGLAALTISGASIAQAPHVCGTDEVRRRLIAEDPSYLDREARYNEEILRIIAERAELRDDELVLTIPIVFHILHQKGTENISNEQILDQVAILNRDYRKLNTDQNLIIPEFQDLIGDVKIEFALPTKDPFGNCHNGIDRIQTVGTFIGEDRFKRNQWSRDKYLNVWISRRMRDGVAGYAYYPDATSGFLQIFDGIMQLANYTGGIGTSSANNSRTLTHEIGHYLNLAHPWGNTNEPGVVCGDDGVADTPITEGWTSCPSPANSAVCDPAIKENYQNYMDYSYCSYMFTVGQVERMRAAAFANVGERSNLWTEQNLQVTGVAEGFAASCAPEADFYAQVGTNLSFPDVPFNAMSCTGTNVRFVDNSQRAFATTWEWTFQDGTPATSTQRNPTVQFNSPGFKRVTLTVGNAQGTTTKSDDFAVEIANQDAAWQAPYTESFEVNEGIWPFSEHNHDLNFTSWQRHVGAGSSGNNSVRLNSGERNPFDIINPDNGGDIDDLVTPNMNLSGISSATLGFFFSYSTQTTDLLNVTEKLEVFSSTDCGRSWQMRTTLAGQNLVTNGATPGAGNWVARNITLPQSVLTNNVRFRFRFTSSEFSGDLYLDDINIGLAVGMDDVAGSSLLNIFPNPTNDQFNVQVSGMDRFSTQVTVQDLRGAIVYDNVIAPQGGVGIEISSRALGLAEGMYVVRATNELGSSAQKIIVGR